MRLPLPQLSHSEVNTPAAPTVPAANIREDFHEPHGIQWRGFGEADCKVLYQRQPELWGGFVPRLGGRRP